MSRDIGPNVRRTAFRRLENEGQREYLERWLLDNRAQFEETMEFIREGAPVQWAKLYKDFIALTTARESTVNVNINRHQDRENLQALVRARINSAGAFTPYEEVKPKELETINTNDNERETTATTL